MMSVERKVNRDLALAAMAFKPDLVLTFKFLQIGAGALAQIRTATKAHVASYWPDPLPMLTNEYAATVPLYDTVFTYSKDTCDVFNRLGAGQSVWLPFAADLDLHKPAPVPQGTYDWDVSFVGTHRPEREEVMGALAENRNLRVALFGNSWKAAAKRNRGSAGCGSSGRSPARTSPTWSPNRPSTLT